MPGPTPLPIPLTGPPGVPIEPHDPSWDERVLAHLQRRIADSAADLVVLEATAERIDDAGLRYLVAGIVADERWGQERLRELANAIRSTARGAPVEPRVPVLRRYHDGEDLETALRALVAVERRHADELRELQHELRDTRRCSLWWILVEQLRRDTEKHLTTLRWMQRVLRDRS